VVVDWLQLGPLKPFGLLNEPWLGNPLEPYMKLIFEKLE
jgi:hypothetical protein